MRILLATPPIGVAVGVLVGVDVRVLVGVWVRVEVGVFVSVLVGVLVGVGQKFDNPFVTEQLSFHAPPPSTEREYD
jgi:hypothetical protein